MACSVAAGKAGRPLAWPSGPHRRYEETVRSSADCIQDPAGRPRGAGSRRRGIWLLTALGGWSVVSCWALSLRPFERAAAHRLTAGAVNPRATRRRVGSHGEEPYKPQCR
ncbi:hypothetical protein OH76DRAFT_1491087 [Lentinus brumalis]|uniref:Uncharacterized protein n=1 Tax=Lentinus brumalis TaxID=2498619 RepID=A0A371CGT3_9APHY|nr:hypothetical protein OH76DRAFT_1491087 [Polyporus brumalis]